MKSKDLYHVGIYLRLSRDDGAAGGRRAESDSISSQRELCRAYVEARGDMEIYDIYIDDGYSGANFQRPGFQRMMADIRGGKVDCIVVKDLSRFGREYIEAGRLLQKTFPAFHVRFIAITDRFDSLTADYNETSLVLPVKNFVNDAYCRDISEKVKSHQRIKREKGEFIGAFAVYGYRRAQEDRGRLAPDGYAARVVRNIFAWKAGGLSATAIARRLNDFGVLSPLEYKQARGERYATSFATGIQAEWSAVAVRRILTNRVYTGALEQGKTEKISVKVNKYQSKPEEDWVRVENAHPAIVSAEEFEQVQRLLGTDSRAGREAECAHLFSGLLFCGDCGQQMTRRVNRYKGNEKVCFICASRNKGRGCTRHQIPEEALREAVLAGLGLLTAVGADWKKIADFVDQRLAGHLPGETARADAEEAWQIRGQMKELKKEEDRYSALKDCLEEDLKSGVIDQEEYRLLRDIYEEKGARARRAAAGQAAQLRLLAEAAGEAKARLKALREAGELAELDREALVTFVRRVEVYEGRRLRIVWNCREQACRIQV